jgi:CHAT domain-containing protein
MITPDQLPSKISRKSSRNFSLFVLDDALRNLPMAALHGKQYLVEKYWYCFLTPGLSSYWFQSDRADKV